MSGQLFLVATPIGNLGDMTIRGIETLKSVDIIACEDTRKSLVLLNRYEIKKPLISYYKHKEREGTEQIISLLDEGKNIALISDAGMPCISDPGSVLVRELQEKGYSYTVVPGANAVVSAVALCGVEGAFTFIGFLPEKTKQRRELLESFINVPSSLIFYSAPHDINRDLDYLYSVLGDRTVYIVKEISKIHESVIKGRLPETKAELSKGEFVIIIEPIKQEIKEYTDEEIIKFLQEELKKADKRTAITTVSALTKQPKNRIYNLAIRL